MTGRNDSGSAGSHAKGPKVRLPLAERKQHLLDQIARDRIKMQQAAVTLSGPLRKVDSLRGSVSGARHWLYPAAPLLALLAFRFRPGWRSLPSLVTRSWAIWRLYRRFR